MKLRSYIFILLLGVLFKSCFKQNSSENKEDKQETKIEAIGKKGIAYTNKKENWSRRTEELNVNWMYSWGSKLHDSLPESVEFSPMFWGKSSVVDENIQRLKELKQEGKIKNILAFNEPDGKKQANITVDEVIALWPKLEEIGLPLGSPGAVHPDKEWMKEFMHKADSLNFRVDFVCVHYYGGASAENFLNKIKRVNEMYNKPIWITEFAVADWKAKTPEENKHSEDDVLWFMQKVLPVLEDLEYVERYAWFDGRRAPYITSSLFDDDLKLTKVGKFYAEFQN